MKKIFYSLGTLVILFLIGLGIKESFFVNDTPKKDSDSNMSISVSDDSEFVDAIEEAKADYETVTEIVLTSNVTLTSEINIKNGQNIRIVNQVNGVEIGQTDLGHTLTVNNTISIDRQASLSLETNTILGSSGTIMASDDNNATNLDFNAELAILDSLTINSNSSLNTSMFNELDLSGSINLVGGEITGDGTLNVNKEAGIIQTSGTYDETVEFTGDGLFVTTMSTAPEDLQHKVTDAQIFSDETLNVSSGTYILTNNTYDLGSLTLTGNLNLFSICDTKINVGASNNITVHKGYSLNIGGISSDNSFYSAGTNQIVIDGGATWNANNNGNYYFVTSAYEAGMDLAGSSVENYGRSKYSASGSTSTTPTIKVTGNGTTLNLYRGVTLQNRINTQTAETGENVGGAISLYGSSRVNLNINGASIRYNALTNIQNSAGGAGIGAQNGDINFIYGDVSYNTLYNSSASNSSDGAGISLVNNSNLTMEEGSKVSYNHGNHDSDADGGGIMVRVNSNLTINGGEVSYNFTYGFGGGICIYTSNVTINNGLVYGNRSTYGGGISTSGTANVTLGEEGESSNLEVAYNTAFTHPDNASSGFGGGVALGNNGADNYLYNQNLYVNDGLIHNNTAVYGGGISNYSTGNSNNNKLHLSGGIISDNKAYSSSQGDGIYAINNTKSGTEPLVVMSGDIQVSTSNNIVFAGLTGNYGTTGSTINLPISNSDREDGWTLWEGPDNDPQPIGDFGTLVATSMNVVEDNLVNFQDGRSNNYNGYFEITPTKNVRFSFSAKKTNWIYSSHANSINLYRDNVLYQTISIEENGYESYENYNVPLYANSTYRFELSQKENDYNVQMRDFSFQEYVANNITQKPIRVSGQLTANGIVGLISYEGSLYSNNAVLAEYTTGNAQVDKFIIDNTNYRIETSGTQVLIVQNTGNIIAYVNNEPFSNLTEAINYIEDNKLNKATIEIINNVNLQATDFITIPTGYNITIKSSDSVPPYTLNIPSNIKEVTNTTLFTVSSGASLTLDNIIIEGNSTQSAGYLIVENNGTFTLNDDATINNNLGIDGYASAIEIGRGKTTTNIYGSITNNIGDYGAIYLSNSEAVVNIYEGAIITGNTYTGNTNGLENITDADIFIENGTLNLNGFSGQIGTIIKQGSGSIKANNISNTTPINIKLNGNNYVRNNVVVEVEGNNDYSSKFNLLEPQDDKEYDSLIKENDGYNIILNMVLTIEISFEDIWQSNGNSYTKISNTNNVHISDANFDTLVKLESLKNTLGLSYDIDYHVGESALFFYIDSTSQLVFTNLANVAARSGYYLNGFVRHGLDETTSNTFYGMDSFISVQNFTDTTSHIYLGVEWLPEQYTLEFNNGGLSTANQTMTNQTIPYSVFETSSPTINPNLYFATGFYFKGWKVRIDSNSYVQDDGSDLILANNAEITAKILNTILSQTNSNTFVLEAVWGSIFGDVKSDGDVNLAHVGTSSQTAFEISTKAGLEALADTVNGNNKTYDGYDYYTNIDSNGKGSFEAFSYENYYFKLTENISDFNLIIGYNDYEFIYNENIEAALNAIINNQNKKPFSGNFNGQGNTIELSLNDKFNTNFVGLFGYTDNANISNLNIDGSVSGKNSVGSLVGFAYGGTFNNITNNADITFAGVNAGGLFGTYYTEQSQSSVNSIRMVINNGSVTYEPNTDSADLAEDYVPFGQSWSESELLFVYEGSRAGGIIGQSWHVNMTDAYNNGAVTAKFGIGGIIGTMISLNEDSRDNSKVNTAFNAGTITATAGLGAKYDNYGDAVYQVNSYVGGIIGRMYGASTINNAMNVADVVAQWRGTYTLDNNGNPVFKSVSVDNNPTIGGRGAGGIVGVTSIEADEDGILHGGNKTISNVINTGHVNAWTHIGGIAGILAYSDLSYSINVGPLTADGTISVGNPVAEYAFLGGLVGLGVSANLFSTAVFDGDIQYEGFTSDGTVQSIGDEEANIKLGYASNNNVSLKLASSHLICQANNSKPNGLDSTFFDSGWTWQSYDDDDDNYHYYPQLASFVNSNVSFADNREVKTLSKEAVRLKNMDGPVDDTDEVDIILQLGENVNLDVDNIQIDLSNNLSITFVKDYQSGIYVLKATVNYLEYRNIYINLTQVEEELTKIGYTFIGWYRDEQFSEEFGGNIYLEANTIYARWEPTVYNINYTNINAYLAGDVQLPETYQNSFTIENTNRVNLLSLNELASIINGEYVLGNGAYDFVTWQYVVGGVVYDVDSFSVVPQSEGRYYITLYNDNRQVTTTNSLSDLEFRMQCEAHQYKITYDLGTGDEKTSNNNRTYFTVEDSFDFVAPNKVGYDFVGWYKDSEFKERVTGISRGTIGSRDKEFIVYAKFEPATYYLSFDLNGGSLLSGRTSLTFGGHEYQIFTDQSTGVRYIEVTYKTSLEGFTDALKAIIVAPDNGHDYDDITTDESGNKPLVEGLMPAGGLQVFVNYDTTTYTIKIDAGQANSQDLSFKDEDISEIQKNLANFEITSIKIDEEGYVIITVEYGSNLADILNELEKMLEDNISSNYAFNGYQTNPDNLSVYNIRLAENTNDISITFLWTENAYNVEILGVNYNTIITLTQDNNYGLVQEGRLIRDKLTNYIKDNYDNIPGYDFTGSFSTINGSPIKDDITLTGYLSIIAEYQKEVYDVQFYENYDDNTQLEEEASIEYNSPVGSTIVSVKPESRPGYDFVGWALDMDGNEILSVNTIYQNIPEYKIVKVYAQWKEATYQIEYEAHFNETWNSPSIDFLELPQTYTFGQDTITLNEELESEGYNFIGYNIDSTSPIIKQIEINNNVVSSLGESRILIVHCHFELKTYQVQFNANGGQFVNDQESLTITVKYNDVLNNNLPSNPTRIGYIFNGYDNASYLSQKIQDIPDVDSLKINALWEIAKYTVTFFADGLGTWQEEYEYYSSININVQEIENANPGYELTGWKGHEDDPKLNGVKVTDNMTFIAIFGKKKIYNLNITLAGIPESLANDVLEALKLGTSTRLDVNVYQFKLEYGTLLSSLYGLEPFSDGTNTYYFAGLSQNIISMPSENTNITISFSTETSSNLLLTIEFLGLEDRPVKYTVSKTNPNVVSLTIDGYNFSAWYESDKTTKIEDINAYIKQSQGNELIVYASYEVKEFNLQYTTDLLGNDYQNILANYGQTIQDVLNDKQGSIPGYIFSGWYIGQEEVSQRPIYQNISGIYAKWTPTNYVLEFSSLGSRTYIIGQQIILPDLSGIDNHLYYNASYYVEVNGEEKFLDEILPNNIMLDLNGIDYLKDILIIDEDAHTTTLVLELLLTPKKYVIEIDETEIIRFSIDDETINIPEGEARNFETFNSYLTPTQEELEAKDYTFAELIEYFADPEFNQTLVLISQYEPTTYFINSKDSGVSFTYNDKYVNVRNLKPELKVYEEFGGWLVNDLAYFDAIPVEELYDLMLSANENIVILNPKIDKKSYLVSFNSNGGTYVSSQNIKYGDNIEKPTDPSKDGYKFEGWYEDENFTSSWDFENDKVEQSISLYAKWTANTYKVTFNNGTNTTEQSFTYDVEATKLLI